jgi:2-polyprenyl-6-methoxyphenol hydroxylase-like FAD-dependent oxidoreductase
MEKEGTKDIVIVGGSLCGLMHGIMLKRLGHNVTILEQSAAHVQHGQAAGIRAGKEVQEFFQKFDLTDQPYFLDCPGLQFIDKDCREVRFVSFPMAMTAWTVLYYRLRANFDGYTSESCPNPPKDLETDGERRLLIGKRVLDIELLKDSVTVLYEDVLNSQRDQITCDLIIGADGCNSTVRRLLLPELERLYAGYVAWRGSILESEATPETVSMMKDNFVVFKMPRTYILVYTIPGPTGSLEPGHRILNYVWYYNCPGDSDEYRRMMTDCDGRLHRNTLPQGKMHPAVWEAQKAYAREYLPQPFIEMIEKTRDPFISSVSDTMANKACFAGGKILLVGDALSLFRPHVALSANQAAVDCLMLEKVLNKQVTIAEWERSVLHYGSATRQLSVMTGNYTQFGGLRFCASALKYGVLLGQQSLENAMASLIF